MELRPPAASTRAAPGDTVDDGAGAVAAADRVAPVDPAAAADFAAAADRAAAAPATDAPATDAPSPNKDDSTSTPRAIRAAIRSENLAVGATSPERTRDATDLRIGHAHPAQAHQLATVNRSKRPCHDTTAWYAHRWGTGRPTNPTSTAGTAPKTTNAAAMPTMASLAERRMPADLIAPGRWVGRRACTTRRRARPGEGRA